ncbi:hypothetical protein [Nocardia fusca]|uniref:Uncharacterized protein n=1 Tax=Nocardia fusca TaxID=941183 RepID=A0ABV3F7E5_9NOCA
MKDPIPPVLKEVAGRLSETLNFGTGWFATNYRRIGSTATEGSKRIRDAAGRAEDGLVESSRTQRIQRTTRAPNTNYHPSDAEMAMAARRMTTQVEFTGDSRIQAAHSSSDVRKMRSTGDVDEFSVYKPIHGERSKWGNETLLPFVYTPGSLTSREIATYRIDEILGFGRVPTTARTAGIIGPDGRPSGPGMIQQFVESGPARRLEEYPLVQRQQVAVLDYITGTFDRRPDNFRTVDRGDHLDLVAIDHGRSFPVGMDPLNVQINSPFVALHRGETLEPEVLDALRNVDTDYLRAAIESAGNIHPNAVDGALARLAKILQKGCIPGDAKLHPELEFPE